MSKCRSCGSSEFISELLGEYRDNLMGVRVVVLNSVKQVRCARCGHARGTLIPHLEGLIAAVAVKRVSLPAKLTGSEIRFLRKALGWRAKDLAAKTGVTAETISRWENNLKPISSLAERFLRLAVLALLGSKAPRISCSADEIVGMRVEPTHLKGKEVVLRFSLESGSSSDEERYTDQTGLAA